jgi:hypothetical protein
LAGRSRSCREYGRHPTPAGTAQPTPLGKPLDTVIIGDQFIAFTSYLDAFAGADRYRRGGRRFLSTVIGTFSIKLHGSSGGAR